ncbi:oxidoreductase, NAD-binding domain protein [Leptospira ryugenii]|uniref:Oxidoreductase, NAD-binding domain protein n=1 Tax=Leptospira ryugenii TaxID=1917863 RepID=A0A2P2DWY1_9LEPT|nr:Gfo/Idh/MocA family oxidoreductase [Leptospira ryugenii]GBF49141.1 oxidoreductase, NAD-binding domain protein [Leptospira ryugenii]
MSETSKIKTLLIGLGRIGTKLEADAYRMKPCTHAGVLFSKWGKKRFDLQAVCDSETLALAAFSSQWKQERKTWKEFTAWEDIQREGLAIDFAIIATRSNSHFALAKALLRQKVPNILIEKPVCLKSLEAKELFALAKRSRSRIWINHERRYHPRYQRVRDLLKQKTFGQVKSVKANVFTSAKNPGIAFQKYGGGPLLHDGTHAIDLLFWLFGSLRLHFAEVKRPRKTSIEDRATAWFTNQEGYPIFLDVSGGRDYFQFEIEIFTDRARLILSNDGFRLFASKESKLYQGFRSLEEVPWKGLPKLKSSNAFLGIYSEIFQNISGKIDFQEGTLEENIKILECIESMYQFRRKK